MPKTKRKLLIVDDDASVLESLAELFLELGFSVRSAEDGPSALLEIRREVPDVLLSDLNMPGMSGFELLSIVSRWFPSIRLIAMSGANSSDKVPSWLAADAFYEKGPNLRILLQIVEATDSGERASSLHHRTPPFNQNCAELT